MIFAIMGFDEKAHNCSIAQTTRHDEKEIDMKTQDEIRQASDEILSLMNGDPSLNNLRLRILISLVQKREIEKETARIDEMLKVSRHA